MRLCLCLWSSTRRQLRSLDPCEKIKPRPRACRPYWSPSAHINWPPYCIFISCAPTSALWFTVHELFRMCRDLNEHITDPFVSWREGGNLKVVCRSMTPFSQTVFFLPCVHFVVQSRNFSSAPQHRCRPSWRVCLDGKLTLASFVALSGDL